MQIKTQLFCFTYAGGTAAFFDVIENDLCGVDVVKLEYAGHGVRHKEPFYQDFDELSEDIYRLLISLYHGGEYALFGYSMGTITLVEVLKRIMADKDMRLPEKIFLAAHEPHTKSELLGFAADELDEWVKNRTIKFGSVPKKLQNNKPFWRTYLPLYRADYTIIGKYEFEKLNLKSEISTTVFYSEKDTPLEEMKLWERYFTGTCEFYQFSGTHFFIQEHHKEIADIILDKLEVNV